GDVDERGLTDAETRELTRDATERLGLSAPIAAAREHRLAVAGDHAVADQVALAPRLVAQRFDLRRPFRADQAANLHLHLLHGGTQRLVDEPGQGDVTGEAVPDAVLDRRERGLGIVAACDRVPELLCEALHRRERIGPPA